MSARLAQYPHLTLPLVVNVCSSRRFGAERTAHDGAEWTTIRPH
ncbi:MAG: hypothetical protein ACFFCJ_08655 [Promethearchaeota archaeon]